MKISSSKETAVFVSLVIVRFVTNRKARKQRKRQLRPKKPMNQPTLTCFRKRKDYYSSNLARLILYVNRGYREEYRLLHHHVIVSKD